MAQVILPAFVAAASTSAASAGAAWAAGTLFAATVGAAVAGAYIDNEIFNDDVASGDERRPDLPTQQIASEGGPALFVIGQEAVVQGQLIWLGPILGTSEDPYVDVAVGFANQITNGVSRIFSRDKDVFDAESSDQWTSTTVDLDVQFVGSWPDVITSRLWLIEPSTAPTPLNTRKVGRDNKWAMVGWTNTVNNYAQTGSYTPVVTPVVSPADQRGVCSDAWTLANGSTACQIDRPIGGRYFDPQNPPFFYSNYYFVGAPADETASIGKPITFVQTFDSVNNGLVENVEVFTGEQDQPLSPVIVAGQAGDPNVTAFGGVSYFTLKKFKLRDFGRVFPADLQVVASSSSAPVLLGSAFSTILDTIAKVDLDYSVAELRPDVVTGYGMRGNLSAAKMLEPLMIAYDVVAQEKRGQIRFFHPDRASIYNLAECDFLEPLRFATTSDVSLPTSLSVQFTDGESESYEVGAITEHVTNYGEGQSHNSTNVTTLDLRMLTMREDQARKIAKRLLWRPRMRRTKVTGRTTRRWAHLNEWDGIVADIFRDGERVVVEFILSKVSLGADGVMEFEGFVIEKLPLGVL